MANNRYLEICSEFRDRNRFPKPGQFEIPISVNGRKSINHAIDPVSLGVPVMSWTSNNLSTSLPGQFKLLCSVEAKTSRLSGLTDTSVFIINSVNRLQQLENYYIGLLIEDAAFFNRRRIKTYKFLGSFGGYDRAQITVESAFPETFVPSNQIYIYDPTDISSAEYPIFWVPNGAVRVNGYVNHILYNETTNDYRNITDYDDTTKCISIDVTNNPLSGWNLNDNYCIRKDKPSIPYGSSGINPVIVSSTLSTIEIDINADITPNNFVRILSPIYNYNLDPPENECRRIVNYNSLTKTINVHPAFSDIPPVGNQIEILNFSYDNLNPFVYTGSLVSQQELVCYEVDLLSITLPTEILSVAEGGYITSYPFMYVELSNTCSAGHRNIIYSNNPNSTRMTFKVPLFDIQDNPTFIKVGGGMSQTIKFKPNDTLLFTVLMPNGEVFDTIYDDTVSPEKPDSRIQISATFSLRRLV
jgi:hypothetical protein